MSEAMTGAEGKDDESDLCDEDEMCCLVCGGEGFEYPDPLWYGFDVEIIPCTSCGGSGLRKDMTWC